MNGMTLNAFRAPGRTSSQKRRSDQTKRRSDKSGRLVGFVGSSLALDPTYEVIKAGLALNNYMILEQICAAE